MLFVIFSDIYINCALFAKMDQVFIHKKKNIKKYWKSQGILSVQKNGNHATALRLKTEFKP